MPWEPTYADGRRPLRPRRRHWWSIRKTAYATPEDVYLMLRLVRTDLTNLTSAVRTLAVELGSARHSHPERP